MPYKNESDRCQSGTNPGSWHTSPWCEPTAAAASAELKLVGPE